MRLLLALIFCASAASADGEQPGDFEYYLLSLSWSPNWCTLEGDAKGDDRCGEKHDYGWTLHGLWPQYDNGWPSFCQTAERPPTRAMTAGMIDIMGSSGLAWHEWKKHGTCSGLSAEQYYRLSRLAYDQIARPQIFRKLPGAIDLPASVVEEAFLESNPDLLGNQITITCKSEHIQEARICLTRDLQPRKCGFGAIRDCTLQNAIMTPVR